MKLRLLRDEDLDETIEVWHETRKESHTAMNFAAEHGVTLDDSQRIFREYIAPHSQLWVAEVRGEIVGFLAIRESYVDRMYVKPSDQRSEIGTALLEKARELSPGGLELHTHRENARIGAVSPAPPLFDRISTYRTSRKRSLNFLCSSSPTIASEDGAGPFIAEHLIESRNLPAARSMLNRCLELEPTDKARLELLQRIESGLSVNTES